MVGQRRKENTIFQDLRNTCLLEISPRCHSPSTPKARPPKAIPMARPLSWSSVQTQASIPSPERRKAGRISILSLPRSLSPWSWPDYISRSHLNQSFNWKGLPEPNSQYFIHTVPKGPPNAHMTHLSAQNIIGSAKVSECRIPLSNDPVFHITLSFPRYISLNPWIGVGQGNENPWTQNTALFDEGAHGKA